MTVKIFESSYQTLHKTCENTVFTDLRFCPYTGEYGSVTTRTLAYFMQ